MTGDTPFFIASIDKLFTAAVILKFYECGFLELDQSIAAYLPPALIKGLHRLEGVDYTDTITVRHLLSHTSGLPDHIEGSPKGGRSLVRRVAEEGDMAWGLEEAIALVREQLKPHFPPQPLGKGAKARYSDTNFLLLIAILEKLTQKTQRVLYRELLFKPLGMKHTFFYPDQAAPGLPAPAALWFGDRAPELPLLLSSLGSIYSTTGDLLIFLRGLFGGKIFDRPATALLMQQQWYSLGFPLDRAALRAPGWPIKYGLGIMHYRLPRIFTPFYRMPAVVGHSGSTGTWLFYCQALDLYFSGSVDQITAGAVPYRIIPRLLQTMEQALAKIHS